MPSTRQFLFFPSLKSQWYFKGGARISWKIIGKIGFGGSFVTMLSFPHYWDIAAALRVKTPAHHLFTVVPAAQLVMMCPGTGPKMLQINFFSHLTLVAIKTFSPYCQCLALCSLPCCMAAGESCFAKYQAEQEWFGCG